MVNFANNAAQQWLGWIAIASWQLAAVVCVVALVALAARSVSARFRHALWLLVLVKCFLPPICATPLSMNHWGIDPLVERTGLKQWGERIFGEATPPQAAAEEHPAAADARISGERLTPAAALMAVWAAGCVAVWVVVAWHWARCRRMVGASRAIEEGPLRIALEQIAMELGVRRGPELAATGAVTSPFLCGVWRQQIILPEKLMDELDSADLRAVLTHELMHSRRHDTWIGWAQVLAQGIYWFHPLVWWANSQIRREREMACDEAVLQLGRVTTESYQQSILRVLTAARSRSVVAGSLVGVFERGINLQARLEEIMNYEPRKQRFGWGSRLAVLVLAILLLPMAPGKPGKAATAADEENSVPTTARLVQSNPKPGETGVDPALTEISLTFDRDMDKGMSWTGGPPLFPPVDKTREAHWIDARTCVLPVKLEKGQFYRVGINSSSFKNFAARGAYPALPSVVYFATAGANAETQNRVKVPKVSSTVPKDGSTDVDPKASTLRVTFDMPMGEGMSWTGGGEKHPTQYVDKKPSWSSDMKTCTLPVKLEPDHEYEIGLNNLYAINFQSKWGVPMEPVVYKFKTRGAK